MNFSLHYIIIIWRTKQIFFCLNLVQCRPPVDFDSCVMEQCEIQNNSLDTSFNNTNQSLHSSRLSNGGGQNNVSFLKRRLFEDEEEDVNLLPEDDEQISNVVTSTQKPKSPPRCDSETEVNLN